MQFINALLESPTMKVGHGLDPCTTTLQYTFIPNRPRLEGRRIVIVDTPGFDDASTDDQRRIASWLTLS